MIAFTVSPYLVTARPHGRTGQWSPVGELSTSVYPHTLGRIETPGNKKTPWLAPRGSPVARRHFFSCGSALTDQVIEGAQGGLGALADRNDDLLVGHGGHVAGGEHTRDVGLALGVHHDLAEAVQLDGALQPV